VPSLAADHVTVHVLDRRVVARHYVLPEQMPGGPLHQLRLYPRPEAVPAQVAVRLETGWEVLGCAESAEQEPLPAGGAPDAPRGLILDLDREPAGALAGGASAEASANLLRVRHGESTGATLGSGDAARAGQRMTSPDAPVAYDLDPAGTPVPSQVLRVDGLAWEERETLYGAGPAQAYAARLGPDGAVTAVFGDGVQGARLPTGRGNVAATYRVGGGAAGEVESEAIDALLGSVRGVKAVRGAGPTAGGADQDDEARVRALAPRRARAFGRAVSAQDLVDLALGYPGVSHAAAWHGAGPPDHACGRPGLHLAFARASSAGPREPLPEEVASLAAYLDARRDATVPLCVAAGVVTPLGIAAALAVDPRRDPPAVAAAAAAALLDPAGPLAPEARSLGQPLDASDLVAVIHGAEGVVGVVSLDLPGAGGLGRRAAERWELLVLGEPGLSAEPAS
jgi:predicted phage baseplate assembly protein